MFEILLALCLADAPAECRVERHAGGETMAACVVEAERLRRAATDMPQEWPCVHAGAAPEFTVTEIAPGVFVHKGLHEEAGPDNLGDLANIGFVIGTEAVAVIDAGGSAEVGRRLLAEIRARTDLPVRWLILTHMHPDHTLGASVFAEAGATLVGHMHLPRAMAARGAHYIDANALLIGEGFAGTEAPGEILHAPPEIDLGGGRILEIEEHGVGHTDNDLTVLDRQTGTWFLGDILFIDHTPAVDGSLTGWIEVLESLAARKVARAVPGHGPVSVDWPEASTEIRAYLGRLAIEIRAAIAEGRPMLDAMETVGGGEGWLLREAFHKRNVATGFQELEWE